MVISRGTRYRQCVCGFHIPAGQALGYNALPEPAHRCLPKTPKNIYSEKLLFGCFYLLYHNLLLCQHMLIYFMLSTTCVLPHKFLRIWSDRFRQFESLEHFLNVVTIFAVFITLKPYEPKTYNGQSQIAAVMKWCSPLVFNVYVYTMYD